MNLLFSLFVVITFWVDFLTEQSGHKKKSNTVFFVNKQRVIVIIIYYQM